MHTFIAHLSQSVFHFNRKLLLAGALIAAAPTITSCVKQNKPQDAAAATAESDSIEARQMAKEEAFLAQKAKEPGVQSLGGGLLYKVLRAGKGAQPTSTSMVTVDYEGKLIDGTIFDSSYQRGESASFPVSGVVAGWQIALKAMHVGDEWEVYIPQYLGYGENGTNNIPPYSTLVFKISLKSVE
jgi:peptidyl-prolyl cis-trans isomerase